MSSVAESSSNVPHGGALVALRRKELAYARMLGVGLGIFLLLWAPLSMLRWSGAAPTWSRIEAGAYLLYGVMLVIPYGRIRSMRTWRRFLGVLAFVSFIFIFVLVFDVLFIAKLFVENKSPEEANAPAERALYVYSDDSGPAVKLPFPALGCAVVFLGLLQVPVVYFSRYPEKMD